MTYQIRNEQKYDKEKYRDMLLEAAETVLGYFGWKITKSIAHEFTYFG
jgi:hypothetical protein